MSILKLIGELSEHEPKDFHAPIPTKNTTRVLTIQDNIPYWFFVTVNDVGWYLLSPHCDVVEVVGLMQPHQIFQYLESLERFFVISLFPISETTWMVSPFNISDAEQRGWKDGSPRYMHLTDTVLDSLQVVEARKMNDDMLLYHQLGAVVSEDTPDMLFAKEIVEDYLNEKRRQEKMATEEGRMQEALEFMGASLVDWKRGVHGYKITWEYHGRQYTMDVNENLRIDSAGVCLAGTDNRHSLASIVAVMEDRHNQITAGRHGDW